MREGKARFGVDRVGTFVVALILLKRQERKGEFCKSYLRKVN